jgi:tetratricopeptide (TPR) repeat protein
MVRQLQTRSVDQTISDAIKAHQTRQWNDAETLYQAALSQRPADAQLLYLMGALYFETRQIDKAKGFLDRALSIDPRHVAAQSMLGVMYAKSGDTVRAIPHLRAALAGSPNSAEAHNHLARALFENNEFAEAEALYGKSLALKPNQSDVFVRRALTAQASGDNEGSLTILKDGIARFPKDAAVHIALARMLIERDDNEAALEMLNACLVHNPQAVDALLLAGNIHYRLGRPGKAVPIFQKLLTFAPNDPTANSIYAAVLLNLGRYDEALEFSDRAVAASPSDAEVLTTHGLVLRHLSRTDDAIRVLHKATQINPALAEAWSNLGIASQDAGQWDAALAQFDRAISLKPGFPFALTNKAHALLALGRLSEGWLLYQARLNKKHVQRNNFQLRYPAWSGKKDKHVRLLIWTDQGLGDEVMYSSMLSDAVANVGHCIFACAPRMVPLFQRSFPDITVMPRSDAADSSPAGQTPDAQISLAELGQFYRPDLSSIPRHAGYLVPDEQKRDRLRAKYQQLAHGRRIVGISWRSENPVNGGYKSVPLELWRDLLIGKDVFLVCLQYGDVAGEIDAFMKATGIQIFVDNVNAIESPDDSAAQIAAMELVITTSNTTAHFAGALDVPVWTLVPTGPGILWYWFLNRQDSPWYPSMRLFRQPSIGDWGSVLSDVERSLASWLKAV